jgi:hypothetical protein
MLQGPYRAGPWPGLTASGARVLFGGALLLGIGQILIGSPRSALPDLPVLGVTALFPIAIAMRMIRAPGVGSAVCGAYLLPRTLLSLFQPGLELPPLLLAPALAFDAAWLLPPTTRMRAAIAGGLFGLLLAVVEPPFAIFLGGDPALWSGASTLVAGAATVVACAVVAPISDPGTARSRRAVPRPPPRP